MSHPLSPNQIKRIKETTIPYDEMDPECVELCKALNALPGIHTTESCCGHDKSEFDIWFVVSDFNTNGLQIIARCLCNRYYGTNAEIWKCELYHGDIDPVAFLLTGKVGCGARAANKLAKDLREYQERLIIQPYSGEDR